MNITARAPHNIYRIGHDDVCVFSVGCKSRMNMDSHIFRSGPFLVTCRILIFTLLLFSSTPGCCSWWVPKGVSFFCALRLWCAHCTSTEQIASFLLHKMTFPPRTPCSPYDILHSSWSNCRSNPPDSSCMTPSLGKEEDGMQTSLTCFWC